MKAGILDRSRLLANFLMVALVAMNIWFSVQYTEGIRQEGKQADVEALRLEERLQNSRFMKTFIDTVLGTNGVISFEDRVKLENDIRTLDDDQAVQLWDSFVASEDSETAQENAVRLMSYLSNKMI
jgi:hypothetical protein